MNSARMVSGFRPQALQRAPRIDWVLGSLLLLSASVAHAAAPELRAAQLAGNWWGEIGTERERIPAGLAISVSAAGELSLRLTQPMMNYYGTDPGCKPVLDAGVLRCDTLHLELRLQDGELVGHFPGPRSPARLARAESLPAEPSPPTLPAGPAPAWTTRVGGQVYAAITVAGELAFVGTTGGVLNALRVADGGIAWAAGLGHAVHGQAAVDAAAVYVVDDSGTLHALSQVDGKPRWTYALGDDGRGRVLPHPNVFNWDWQGPRPLVVGGRVYTGSTDGSFHAVDAATGKRVWRSETGHRIRSGAASADGRVVLGSGSAVVALDAASGAELWRFETGAEVDAVPLIHANRVFIGNRGYGLYALDAEKGSEIWKQYFWGSWVESSAVIVDQVLYIGSSDLRRISAIDPGDGRVLWRSDVFGWSWGTPLVDGDRIHVGAAGGSPYFIKHVASFTTLERSTGRMLSRHPLPDTGGHQWGIAGSPALAGDWVLVATIEGSVMAFPRPTGGK